MNRQRLLKQRAARNGVFIIRSTDSKKGWDLVDKYGTHGYVFTKREAINLAAKMTAKK